MCGYFATLFTKSVVLAQNRLFPAPGRSDLFLAAGGGSGRPPLGQFPWGNSSSSSLAWLAMVPHVPRQLFLPIWRQSVLPVHLLGLAPLLGRISAVAGDVKLEDDGVMDHPVDGRGGGHGVGEDVLPLREDQV